MYDKHDIEITDNGVIITNTLVVTGLLSWVSIKLVAQNVADTVPDEISHEQFVIMAILLWQMKQKESTTQTIIAKMSKLDKMTISKSLKKLSTMGLIHRSEDKVDTRAKQVILTSKGIELANELIPIIENIDKLFFNKLAKNNQQSLIQFFLTLLKDSE